MLKSRIYIFQFVGVIMLLCVYLVGNRPDYLSAMHFDPSSPTSFNKVTKSATKQCYTQNQQQQNNNKQKSRVPSQTWMALMQPYNDNGYEPEVQNVVVYSCPLPDSYRYLFYEEINPPPPKA